MQLECFPMNSRPPDIVPGRPQRAWMESFLDRHPYRCLPLTMANTTGWEVLCPVGFTAEWNGGTHQNDITLTPDHPYPEFADFAKSHFSHGVVTFHPGYLFRTEPGWDMWCGGPPNHIKDGIQPLVGVVETDWLPFPFTMNWVFTRPGRIRFEKRGWWRGELVLGGLRPNRDCRVQDGGRRQRARSDGDGTLTLRFDGSEGGGPAREVVIDVD